MASLDGDNGYMDGRREWEDIIDRRDILSLYHYIYIYIYVYMHIIIVIIFIISRTIFRVP